MYKLTERLISLAYAYADEINNYAEDYLIVRRVDAHNLLVRCEPSTDGKCVEHMYLSTNCHIVWRRD